MSSLSLSSLSPLLSALDREIESALALVGNAPEWVAATAEWRGYVQTAVELGVECVNFDGDDDAEDALYERRGEAIPNAELGLEGTLPSGYCGTIVASEGVHAAYLTLAKAAHIR